MCSENTQTTSSNDESADLNSLPFEKALEKLEDIVNKMENENLPIEEMIKYYERGSKLASFCENKLKEFEKRIDVLIKENKNGGEWAAFDTTDNNADIELRDK